VSKSSTKSTFEDLNVWKEARQLRKDISSVTKSFPTEEKYKLTDQMLRASRSVTANIAEGYGRFHFQENIQFCRQARGSLYELVDHLTVAFDEKYLPEDHFFKLKEHTFLVIKILNGYISYLKKQKNEQIKK